MTNDKLKNKTSTIEVYNQIYQELQKKKSEFNGKIEEIKALKTKQPQYKDVIKKLSTIVNKLKEEINKLTKECLRVDPDKLNIDRDKFMDMLTIRMFVMQNIEIYGGVGGFYDYGSPACAIKTNLLNLWRQHFILNENLLELDCVSL